jgi:hypothetical protein
LCNPPWLKVSVQHPPPKNGLSDLNLIVDVVLEAGDDFLCLVADTVDALLKFRLKQKKSPGVNPTTFE